MCLTKVSLAECLPAEAFADKEIRVIRMLMAVKAAQIVSTIGSSLFPYATMAKVSKQIA